MALIWPNSLEAMRAFEATIKNSATPVELVAPHFKPGDRGTCFVYRKNVDQIICDVIDRRVVIYNGENACFETASLHGRATAKTIPQVTRDAMVASCIYAEGYSPDLPENVAYVPWTGYGAVEILLETGDTAAFQWTLQGHDLPEEERRLSFSAFWVNEGFVLRAKLPNLLVSGDGLSWQAIYGEGHAECLGEAMLFALQNRTPPQGFACLCKS